MTSRRAYTTNAKTRSLIQESSIADYMYSSANDDDIDSDDSEAGILDPECAFIRLGRCMSLMRWIKQKKEIQDSMGHKDEKSVAISTSLQDDALEDIREAVRWLTTPRSVAEMTAVLDWTCKCSLRHIMGLKTTDNLVNLHDIGLMRYLKLHNPLGSDYHDGMPRRLDLDKYRHCKPGTDAVQHCAIATGQKLTEVLIDSKSGNLVPRDQMKGDEWFSHGLEGAFSALAGWFIILPTLPVKVMVMDCLSSFLQAVPLTVAVAPYMVAHSQALFRGIMDIVGQSGAEWSSVSKERNATKGIEQFYETSRHLGSTASLLAGMLAACVDPVFGRLVQSQDREIFTSCMQGHHLAVRLSGLYTAPARLRQENLAESSRLFLRFAARMIDISPPLLNTCLLNTDDQRSLMPHCVVSNPNIHSYMKCYSQLSKLFRTFINYPLCQRPGCRHGSKPSGAPMDVCGGYRIMFYCSRRCHKQAWVDPIVPHSDICTALRVVYAGLSKTFTTNQRKFRRRKNRNLCSTEVHMIRAKENLVRYVVEKLHQLIDRGLDCI